MRLIKLSQGCKAIVDNGDYFRISQYKWNVTQNGHGYFYARRLDGKTPVYMHREVMYAKKGQEVDHINKDTLDNRSDNLRIVSRRSQRANSSKRKDNRNEYKGVHIVNGKYITARICGVHLGMFETEKDAAQSYNEAAVRLFGEHAQLNEIS